MSTMSTRSERGNVALMMIAVVVLAGVLCIVIARVGGAAVAHARADTAADAAALAAADELARGGSSSQAAAVARAVARADGANLERCICAGEAAEVEVTYGDVRGHARAEIGQADH